MTKIWVTSDNHFNHKNIIKYCNRPFYSVEEMNRIMINKWNSKVAKTDIVIYLGDFAMRSSNIKYFKERLNGTIILVAGNHDLQLERMEEQGFVIVRDNLIIDNFILSHRPLLKEDIPEGFINVHGHIHDKNSYVGINVSVEKTNYEPIELLNLKKKLKQKNRIEERYHLYWIQDDYDVFDTITGKYVKKSVTEEQGNALIKRLVNNNLKYELNSLKHKNI